MWNGPIKRLPPRGAGVARGGGCGFGTHALSLYFSEHLPVLAGVWRRHAVAHPAIAATQRGARGAAALALPQDHRRTRTLLVLTRRERAAMSVCSIESRPAIFGYSGFLWPRAQLHF